MADPTMRDKRPMSTGWFLVIWAYLMVLSIALAPVAAHFIQQAMETPDAE